MHLVAAVVVAVGGAGCGSQVTIKLTKDPGLSAAPPFVKIHMRALGEPLTKQFGPFPTNAVLAEQFTPQEPGVPFFIDVIGCNSDDPDVCVDPLQFNARGCSDVLVLPENGAPLVVTIALKDATEGGEVCPPNLQ